MSATLPRHTRPRLAIRPVVPSDRPALERAFAPVSRYERLHSPSQRSPAWIASTLTEVDGVDHVALVALEQQGGQPYAQGVGVARFVRNREARHIAELAVTVIDRAQGRGIGRTLIAELSKVARASGIKLFTMVIPQSNRKARALAAKLGAVVSQSQGEVVTYHLPLLAFEPRSREAPRLIWA